MHPNSPPYQDLFPSDLLDSEDGIGDLPTAPVRMVNSGGAPEDPDAVVQEPGAANAVAARQASLEEQVRDQRQTINQLSSKLDQFIELMMNNQGAPSCGTLQQVVDPRAEELLGDTHAEAPLNAVR